MQSNATIFESYRARLQPLAAELGVELPTWDICTGSWDQLDQVQAVLEFEPEMLTFTFGIPSPDVADLARKAGHEPWVSCASADMIDRAIDAGFTQLIVQGAEAGGHRSLCSEADEPPNATTQELVRFAQRRGIVALVAAGGVDSAQDAQAFLVQGVHAVQVGSLFLCTDESGVSQAGKEYLRRGLPTRVTRSFSGRPARGVNALAPEEDVPALYPELNVLTQPLREAAKSSDRPEFESLWVGRGHHQLPAGTAAEVIRSLFPGTAA